MSESSGLSDPVHMDSVELVSEATDEIIEELAEHIARGESAEVLLVLNQLKDVPLDAMFGQALISNEALMCALCQWLVSETAGVKNDPICSWFYSCYESRVHEMRCFVSAFIPALVYLYITRHSSTNPLSALETVLIGIYGVEVVARRDRPRLFTPPVSSSSSVYHTAVLTEQESKLTEKALQYLSGVSGEAMLKEEALPALHDVSASDRLRLVRVVLQQYSAVFGSMPDFSRQLFCLFVAQVASDGVKSLDSATIGDNWADGVQLATTPVSGTAGLYVSGVFRELITVLARCMSGKNTRDGAIIAINQLKKRAEYHADSGQVLAVMALMDK